MEKVELTLLICDDTPTIQKEGKQMLCPSIVEEVRKMINCLKNRKEKMEMEMEIIRKTLGKVRKIPKDISNIIHRYSCAEVSVFTMYFVIVPNANSSLFLACTPHKHRATGSNLRGGGGGCRP